MTIRRLRILLLGGTTEGRVLAQRLASRADVTVISSLAGRTTHPVLPHGNVRVGGFCGVTGLGRYLEHEAIDAVIDATHPFAATISRNAVEATTQRAIPLLVLERPVWSETPDDRWQRAPDLAAAAQAVAQPLTRVLLTIGRQGVGFFAACKGWFLIRSVEPPEPPLPRLHEVLLARGPFTVEEERNLMRERSIDVVVSKNSGGDATYAKLVAARELGIPVVLIDRPANAQSETVADVEAAVRWVHARARALVRSEAVT